MLNRFLRLESPFCQHKNKTSSLKFYHIGPRADGRNHLGLQTLTRAQRRTSDVFVSLKN